MVKISHSVLMILILAMLGGCISIRPQSAADLYQPNPGAQSIRGSIAHAENNQLVDFTGKQVLNAVRATLAEFDYQIDFDSGKSGLVASSSYHHCGGSYRLATALAIYVTPVDTYPTTRIIVRADLLDGACQHYDLQMRITRIIETIQMKLQAS
ncbi:MAG: hypothetical protein AAF353_06560 [Pseudomonadota bacterium]